MPSVVYSLEIKLLLLKMPALVFYTVFCKFIHSVDKYSWTRIKEPPIKQPEVAHPGKGPVPPPLFLNQIEARRAEKHFFETAPPYLKVWIRHWPAISHKIIVAKNRNLTLYCAATCPVPQGWPLNGVSTVYFFVPTSFSWVKQTLCSWRFFTP